jgi:hypothetical protein
MVSFLPAFPPISYMQSSTTQFVLHVLSISSSLRLKCKPNKNTKKIKQQTELSLSPAFMLIPSLAYFSISMIGAVGPSD